MEKEQHIRYRPQDDIPYERRMLYIICGYRKLYEQNEKLAEYAKLLERKNEELKVKCYEKGATNKELGEINVKLRRENKRLKAYIQWLKDDCTEQQEKTE